jgi:hypothetical protein
VWMECWERKLSSLGSALTNALPNPLLAAFGNSNDSLGPVGSGS